MPGKFPVSLVADDVQASDIIFTTEDGTRVGTIKVVDGKFIFEPSSSNLDAGSFVSGPAGPQGLQGPTGPTGPAASDSLIRGTNFGDYLFWNGSAWEVGNTKVKIGRFAGQTGQGENSIAIGYKAASINQPDNSIVLNATGEGWTGSTGNALFVAPIREEISQGISSSFSSPVTSTQSTNVLSYNNSSREITYRDLGLVSDNTPNLTPEGSESNTRIISKYSIIPNIDGNAGASQGLSLGNKDAYWLSVHTRELHTTGNTIYIAGDDGSQMSIKYDPNTLGAVLSNDNTTVKAVTTSASIPGQIDASLLPFTGFSYVGNVNPKEYSQNVGQSFKDQALYMLYNKRYDILSSSFTPNEPSSALTKDLFQLLSGSYYVVSGLVFGESISINFSKLSASTDLEEFDKNLSGNFTSTFTESENETFSLGNSDMIILSIGLEPSKITPGVINFVAKWSQVNFRVPINGINTLNIIDSAVTNPKISNNSITASKLANGSVTSDKILNSAVTSDKIATNSITLTKLSPDLQNLIVKVDGSVSQDSFQSFLTDFSDIKSTSLSQGNLIVNLQNTVNNKVDVSDFNSTKSFLESAIENKVNVTDFNQQNSRLVNLETSLGNKVNVTDLNSTTSNLTLQINQKIDSSQINSIKSEILAQVNSSLNTTLNSKVNLDVFNQTIKKMNDVIYNYELRMYALDQFMKVFSETFTIKDINNNSYYWDGMPNPLWFAKNFGFTFYAKRNNTIYLNVENYVRTSLYGKIVVRDSDDNIIKEITAVDGNIWPVTFQSLDWSLFPLTFSWITSTGSEYFYRTLQYNEYDSMSEYTIGGITPFYITLKNENGIITISTTVEFQVNNLNRKIGLMTFGIFGGGQSATLSNWRATLQMGANSYQLNAADYVQQTLYVVYLDANDVVISRASGNLYIP